MEIDEIKWGCLGTLVSVYTRCPSQGSIKILRCITAATTVVTASVSASCSLFLRFVSEDEPTQS